MSSKVELVCFTDPFCSWCWASEPALFALRERYREQLSIRYVMGGLVKDMSAFFDASNDIRGTAEVAPHWRMVSERSGQPIDDRVMLDITDPHFSTWPANLAVKAAALQATDLGDRFLRRLRRAALTERAQIQKPEVQLALAPEVAGLDVERLRRELADPRAAAAFDADLKLCRQYGVTGFPTMMFRSTAAERSKEPGILLGGFRSRDTLENVVAKLAPGLQKHEPRGLEDLLRDFGPLTTRELAEVTGRASVEQELRAAASAGTLVAREVPRGVFWSVPGAAPGT